MEVIVISIDQLRAIFRDEMSGLAHPPAPKQEPDELLTPEETAKLLKVSKVTVWDWAKRGILPRRHIGNQVRYLRSEVLAAAVQKGKLIGAAHA